MRVTVVLETGGVFPWKVGGKTYQEIGYFETPGPNDIEVSEYKITKADTKLGKGKKPGTDVKVMGKGKMLGKSKKRGIGKEAVKRSATIIDVEHVKKNGKTVKKPVNRSPWFELDLMGKNDLYSGRKLPAFKPEAYDCILRFHSGHFHSADVRPRRFTEHWLSNNRLTGEEKWTRAIANEIHVEYDIADGEELRLRRDGQDVWSSSSVGPETVRVIVKILAHDSLNPYYHREALDHKGLCYYLPNSDPPPMNGNKGG